MVNQNFDFKWINIRKEFASIKEIRIVQNDIEQFINFKKFIKIIFYKTTKNIIINSKILILIKRIFKIIKNNENEFDKFDTNCLYSAMNFIILKHTIKTKMSNFMRCNSKINIFDLNEILDSFYSKFYLEKISFYAKN